MFDALSLTRSQTAGEPVSAGIMTRRGWMIWSAALAALSATAIALFYYYESGLPSHSADGFYSNDCCGTIELRGGHLLVNGIELVSYSVQRDDQGPYILPRAFVGAESGGVVLDGGRRVMKLRLNVLPNPNRIAIPSPRGPDSFERTMQRRS